MMCGDKYLPDICISTIDLWKSNSQCKQLSFDEVRCIHVTSYHSWLTSMNAETNIEGHILIYDATS